MEKIIYDIPMGKFLQEYFEKRLVYEISIGKYPNSNSVHNALNVMKWIQDVQSVNFNRFVFTHSIHQANNKIVHFQVSIFDSNHMEHKFNVWMDIQQTVRKVKLNKIKSKVSL